MRKVSLVHEQGEGARSLSSRVLPVTNDAFRTLATDQDFKDKVSEEALVRLLDAFAWSHLGEFELGSLFIRRVSRADHHPSYSQTPSPTYKVSS